MTDKCLKGVKLFDEWVDAVQAKGWHAFYSNEGFWKHVMECEQCMKHQAEKYARRHPEMVASVPIVLSSNPGG